MAVKQHMSAPGLGFPGRTFALAVRPTMVASVAVQPAGLALIEVVERWR
jgi:hypothetical protein